MNDKRKIIYNCNDYLFSKNKEESFYWAGFFAADGNVSKNGDVNLGVAIKDENHLYKFKLSAESSAPIKTVLKKDRIIDGIWTPETLFSLIRFRSKQMTNDLKRFNIVPNKTKTYELPEWLLNHELLPHFIRGYFDGDGWFAKRAYKKDRIRISWGICGNFSVLQKIKNELITQCNLRGNPKIIRQKNIFRMEFSKQHDVLNIVNWIYGESTLFLDRKYEISKIVSKCDQETIILNIKKDDLIEAHNRLKSYALMAKEFNCSKSSISNYMKKYKD